MTTPSQPIMVRLPPELAPSWDALKREFPGIPQSMLLRFVLISVFRRPLAEQVALVDAQIKGGGKPAETRPDGNNRVESLAANRRHRR